MSRNMETIGRDLREMQRTPLAAAHVEALRAAGEVVTYPAGTFLARPGEPTDRFVYVEEGEIEVVNPYTNERHFPSTLGPTQFMGEISFVVIRIDHLDLAFLDINEAISRFAGPR